MSKKKKKMCMACHSWDRCVCVCVCTIALCQAKECPLTEFIHMDTSAHFSLQLDHKSCQCKRKLDRFGFRDAEVFARAAECLYDCMLIYWLPAAT